MINFDFQSQPTGIKVFDAFGRLVASPPIYNKSYQLNIDSFGHGVYFYLVTYKDAITKGKFIVNE